MPADLRKIFQTANQCSLGTSYQRQVCLPIEIYKSPQRNRHREMILLKKESQIEVCSFSERFGWKITKYTITSEYIFVMIYLRNHDNDQ